MARMLKLPHWSVAAYIGILLLMRPVEIAAIRQDEAREPGTYLVFYEISGARPSGFVDFHNFKLDAPVGQDASSLPEDQNGNVRLAGRITTTRKRHFEFASATLGKANQGERSLSFTTKRMGGTYYVFRGHFLQKPVQEKKGGDYTHLRGVLMKYSHNRLVASAELGFHVFAIL